MRKKKDKIIYILIKVPFLEYLAYLKKKEINISNTYFLIGDFK